MTLRTFIVEDSATIRQNLIETLNELAMVEAVGEAETEQEGRRWFERHREEWDLTILDLFLSQGSGLNILTAFQRRHDWQKVVVLSNHATADIRALGADAVFDKSTQIGELVDYCIRQHGARDDGEQAHAEMAVTRREEGHVV